MDFPLFLEFSRRGEMTQKDAFEESFALVDLAEKVGVDSVWLAEYHFNVDRSVLSAPITVASAIAARTERMRIGLAVHILPLGNPVRIAEEVATLDPISHGRLEFGIGRGTFPNVHEGYGVPFHESRSRFDEYLEVIVKAWTNDTFSFQGEHFSCTDVGIAPHPYQLPHPPITVGITSVDSFPIIGQMGYSILINPSRVFALNELEPHIQGYREAWKQSGHPGKPKVGLRMPFYVAETAEKAHSGPLASTMHAIDYGARELSLTAASEEAAQRLRETANVPYDEILRRRVMFGTPEAVVERLHEYQETLGISGVVLEMNYGGQIPSDRVVNSTRLLTEKVMPEFK